MAFQVQSLGSWSPRAGGENALRTGFALWLLLAAAILTAFAPTAVSIVMVWSNSVTYGHGFLILPIVGFMVWRRRGRLAGEPIHPSIWGGLAVVGAAILWFAGEIAGINVVRHFALAFMLQGTVLAVFGWRFVRVLLVPLLYLLFAVPFGDFLVPPLQDLTAQYTTLLVRWSGVPIHMDNWHLVIPGGAFLVAEACSGVRYLIASLALGVLICDLMFRKTWKIAAFILLSAAVPVIANVFRAYGIVMLAHWSDFEIAVGVDHLIYGWIFLSFVTLILIAIAVKMQDEPEPATPARPREESGTPGLPLAKTAMVAVGLLAGSLAVKGYAAAITAPRDIAAPELSAPQVAGWERAANAEPHWQASHPGADVQESWLYERDGDTVTLYLAFYTHERPGAELISHHNSITESPDDSILGRGRGAAGLAEGLPAPQATRLRTAGELHHVWHWYWVNGRFTAEPAIAKLHAFLAKTLQGEQRAAVIAVSSNAGEESAEILGSFLDGVAIGDWLNAAPEGKPEEPAVATMERDGG